MMKNRNWINKRIKDITLEDAMEANNDGVDFVCMDGKLAQVVTDSNNKLLSIIRGREV
jgi:predicted transcriptional regulator